MWTKYPSLLYLEQDAKLSELWISYLWTGNNSTYFRGWFYGVRYYIDFAACAWWIIWHTSIAAVVVTVAKVVATAAVVLLVEAVVIVVALPWNV